MIERWRPCPIAGLEHVYEVSDRGQLRRVLGGKGTRAGFILKPKMNGQYFGWMLTFNGYRKVHYVHELVALAFIGPRPTRAQINHKNLDKFDNRVENLEYLSHADNGRHAASLGVGNFTLKLCEQDEVLRLYNAGVRPSVLAKMFKIDRSTPWQIRRSRRKRAHLVPRDLDQAINRVGDASIHMSSSGFVATEEA